MYSLKNSSILYEASKSKHKAHFVVQLLIFVAIFIVSSLVTAIIVGMPVGISMAKTVLQTTDLNELMSGSVDVAALTQQLMSSLPEWFASLSLFATLITTCVTFLYCRKIEGRSFASMGLKAEGFLKKYGVGYLIGMVMIISAVGLAVMLGAAEFTGFNSEVSWLYIALPFVGYLVQGMSEEVLCRGYLAVSLANKTKVSVAVGVSSVVFAMLHLGNAGIAPLAFINLALFGVFMGVYMFRTDDLWGACAIHSSWNFIQGNVLGVSVSGGMVSETVFGTAFVEGRELISGGSFGIEGGICTTIVLLAAVALTLYLPMKPRPELPEEPETDESIAKEPIPLYIKK